MPLYRPRCRLVLILPTLGSTREKRAQAEREQSFELEVPVSRALLTQNDHNHADELEVEISYQLAGVDPRFLKNACCRFYLGDVGESNERPITKVRFAGIATEPSRTLDESKKTVRIKFLDYTSLFLRSKPFPAAGIPSLTSSLLEAWQRICDHTGYYDLDAAKIVSSVAGLRDAIVFEGNADPSTVLGSAVSSRLAKLGKVDPGLNKNAWEVWQHVVGMLGLISYVRGTEVVVTDAVAHYTSEVTPVFLWGHNILKVTEKVDTNRAGKFIALVSVNPLTGGVIEAFWPPRDQKSGLERQKQQPRKTKKPTADGNLTPVNEYEFHPYPYGVTDERVLEDCAHRVYEERSRQELTGELLTREMRVPTTFEPRDAFDVLSLASGDVIQVRIDPNHARDMKGLEGTGVKIAFLRDVHGYSDSAARLVVANLDGLGSLPPNFLVRTVRTELAFTATGGTFNVNVDYCNRIQEDGSAHAG